MNIKYITVMLDKKTWREDVKKLMPKDETKHIVTARLVEERVHGNLVRFGCVGTGSKEVLDKIADDASMLY